MIKNLSIVFGVGAVVCIILFGFIFFEPFLTEEEVNIKVVNMEKWMGERSKYFIFTENEVFLNANNYYQNKENADELYVLFKKGYSYKVKVVGLYIPFLPRFRNIINIIESKDSNTPLPLSY